MPEDHYSNLPFVHPSSPTSFLSTASSIWKGGGRSDQRTEENYKQITVVFFFFLRSHLKGLSLSLFLGSAAAAAAVEERISSFPETGSSFQKGKKAKKNLQGIDSVLLSDSSSSTRWFLKRVRMLASSLSTRTRSCSLFWQLRTSLINTDKPRIPDNAMSPPHHHNTSKNPPPTTNFPLLRRRRRGRPRSTKCHYYSSSSTVAATALTTFQR